MTSEEDQAIRETKAMAEFQAGGGLLFPFRQGYEATRDILERLPQEAWRRDEAVLAVLALYLMKQGQAVRAKSYLVADALSFEKTDVFTLVELLTALHLGEPVSEGQLRQWRRLERSLPLADPLLLGLYYNAMMAMHVRFGRADEARVAGQQAISCYREDGHIYLEHFIHIHLADLDIIEGRLHRAQTGLMAAKRCLAQTEARYGNEDEVIEIIQLAIAFERGAFAQVLERSAVLRASLMSGDSWSELFNQLARISILSTYFLKGRAAAQAEIADFQADYARRHNGESTAVDALRALIWQLEWSPGDAERVLDRIGEHPMHSTTGSVVRTELECTMGLSDGELFETPRSEIIRALHQARHLRGPKRRLALERALRLASDEGHIAPFLEHRDVFLGLNAALSSKDRARIPAPMRRFTNRILRLVSDSYVIPEPLRALGFNQRQYRVASALLSGATNKQIARQLGTSEATVKYHLTTLYRLLNVRKRSQFIDVIGEI